MGLVGLRRGRSLGVFLALGAISGLVPLHAECSALSEGVEEWPALQEAADGEPLTDDLLLPQLAAPMRPVEGTLEAREVLKMFTGGNGYVVLPVAYYTPDTSLGMGGILAHYFRAGRNPENGEDSARLSYATLMVDYTLKRQLDAWLSSQIFTAEEKWMIRSDLRFRNWRDRFYGIGNQTPLSAEERFDVNLAYFEGEVQRQLAPKFFAGVNALALLSYGASLESGGLIETQALPGAEREVSVGLGLSAQYDTRDNVVAAHSGHLVGGKVQFFNPLYGSTLKYWTSEWTGAKYFELKPGHVIGVHGLARIQGGDVPFFQLASAGDDDILRGYARNRYRDRRFVGAQAEYRMPLFWRFRGAVFAGLGDVFNRIQDVGLDTIKYTYGLGLRFVWDPKERIHLRVDYGFGRNSQAFYIMLKEAF